ncbi:MAG: DNA repair protein RadC [Lachnospiraceae bacterium]|nr:DNA repair protein RadC [Lachnospiraceae bacterium]
MRQTIKDLPDHARPFEKMELYGPDALSDAELIAVIFRCGTREKNSVELAEEVIRTAGGSIAGITSTSDADFQSIAGIGRVKLLQIRAASELAARMERSRRRVLEDCSGSDRIASLFFEEMRSEPQEVLKALYLTTKMRLIRVKLISKGSVNRSMVPVREIFVEALRSGAVYVVLMHNHPSGDPEPSDEDVKVTKQVISAGRLVGIELMDHLVFGDRSYVSMRQKGWVP